MLKQSLRTQRNSDYLLAQSETGFSKCIHIN